MSAEVLVHLKQLLLIAGIAAIFWAIYRSRRSDIEAIQRYAESQGLKVVRVRRDLNYFRYPVTNIARMYMVTTRTGDGHERELYLAFEPLPPGRDMKVGHE